MTSLRAADVALPPSPSPGPSRLRRNLRYCTWDGILAAPTVFLVTLGNLVVTVLLTQYYHLSTTQFGLLVALQAACSTLLLPLVPRLNHRYSAKQLSVFGAWVQWAAFLALTAVIGWLPPAGPPPVFPILFGVFLAIAAMQALMAITWPSWVQEFTPERIRGKYFGRRNMILQIITVVFLVLMGSCLAQAGVDHGLSVKVVLMVLIGLSMLVRTGSIWMQHRTFSPADLHVPAATVRRSETDQKTAGRYVDILCGAFLVRRLSPWFANTGKRLVKAPKVYLRDSGLLHALLGLRTPTEVRTHPRLGASWEGFALEQVMGLLQAEREAYFWGTHGGAELDLLINRGGMRVGFEFKFAESPATTKSMRVAMTDLILRKLYVVYPGTRRFELDKGIIALPLTLVAVEPIGW